MVFVNHMEILGGKAAIVEIQGALNSQTSPDFEDYLNQLMQKNIFYMLFDASKMEYISSDGIGLALFLQKSLARKNGCLVMYNLPDEVSSLFRLLGFDKVFTIAASRIEAMQIMDRQIEMRSGPEAGEAGAGMEHRDERMEVDVGGPHRGEEASREIPVSERLPEKPERTEFDPIIVECRDCRTLIRVKKSGDYICPSCKIEFSVDGERTVKFR